ncbi:MAG TPA: T9SS type A sorting domain-containing protein, partial [Bacteroidia bacterium]|nr:T9SS type A sorting domain-containing protein [Bacteroidia bacterium]
PITASVDNDTICRGTMVNLDAVPPSASVQITNGNTLNTSTTYPAPYGNWFGGSRHQMLILASELSAAGLTAGNITGMTFQVTNTNASDPLMNFTISLGSTNVSSLTTTFETSPMTTVYTNASYMPFVGTNTHLFSTPFYWDGVSNIIVETCFINQTGPSTTSYTSNCTMRQAVTSFASTNVYYQDNDLNACSAVTGWTTYNQRPNIAFLHNVGAYTYAWTPAVGLSDPTAENPTTTPLTSTTYTVVVTDTLSGCTTTSSVLVTVQPTPSPNLGADTTICSNTPLVLDGSAGSYTYLWQDNSTAQTFTVNAAGNYYVTVTDAGNGCSASDTVVIGMNTAPSFTLGPDVTVCQGTASTFSGPSGEYHFLWNTNATTQSVSETLAGNYSLMVTDTVNSCFSSDTVMLNVNPNPPATLGADTAICSVNAPLVLTAPAGNYSYMWSDNTTNQTLNASSTGTYSVVVTDNVTSCFTNDTILVTVNPNPVVSLGNDTTFCSGDGPITFTAPAGPYTYLWSDNSTGNTFSTNTTGNYMLTVTDVGSGCVSSDAINVSVNATPPLVFNDTMICGSPYTETPNTGAGFGYLWSTGATTPSIVINSPGGFFWVTVTEAISGCSITDSAQIDVNIPPVATFSLPATICSADAAFAMNGSPAGGVYTGPGVAGNMFNPTTAGPGTFTISYVYTDPSGCSDSVADVITVSPCTGVQEQSLAAGMGVYPNPTTNGQFTFTIQGSNYSEVLIEVTTVEGKIVYSDKVSDVKGDLVKPINLWSNANGVYFLRVNADGQTYVQKIVMEK